jgi:hypothetical protein
MIRVVAVVAAAAFIVVPDLAGAQSKSKDSPTSASRFGISIDGVQKPKAKGLKSSAGKKGDGTVKNYKIQNAWPKKGY